jgi:hypothetical protein
MKKIVATVLMVAATSPVMAADMGRGSMTTSTLSPEAEALASEMAGYMSAAKACRATDGTNLNRFYWEPRINSVVAPTQRVAFSNVVKSRAAPMFNGPDVALKCDDYLDVIEDRYPSFAEAPTATPLCWSDVTDLNRCEGTGDDDILAGVDALAEGY